MRTILLIAAALVVLAGCGSRAERSASEPSPPPPASSLPAAGEWEVVSTLVELHAPNLGEAERAQIVAGFGSPKVERRCLDGLAPRVGGEAVPGRCTYTRIADAGPRVERDSVCPAEPSGRQTGESRGVNYPDRFDWVISMRVAEGPFAGNVVRLREMGRRIAPDCSAALVAAGGRMPVPQ